MDDWNHCVYIYFDKELVMSKGVEEAVKDASEKQGSAFYERSTGTYKSN